MRSLLLLQSVFLPSNFADMLLIFNVTSVAFEIFLAKSMCEYCRIGWCIEMSPLIFKPLKEG
jgi:hypothetical protein